MIGDKRKYRESDILSRKKPLKGNDKVRVMFIPIFTRRMPAPEVGSDTPSPSSSAPT